MKSKVDIEPGDFTINPVFKRTPKKKVLKIDRQSQPEEMIGKLLPGCEIFGFTMGRFSLSDLIEFILDEIGQADLYLSTWTASQEGLEKAFEFLRNKKIRSIKFMVDRGFKQFKGKPYKYLMEKFGNDCIRTTRIHAKFAIIRNENWNIVIRTSMNLNKNLRLENFEITDCKEFADFFQSFIDEAFKVIKPNENFKLESSQKLDNIFDNLENTKTPGDEFNFDDFDIENGFNFDD